MEAYPSRGAEEESEEKISEGTANKWENSQKLINTGGGDENTSER